MFRSKAHARLVGERGRRLRWARSTSEERQATMAKVRAAQRAKYLDRAKASPGGDRLSDADLAYRADQLRLADLAAYRLRAYDALQARRAAQQ